MKTDKVVPIFVLIAVALPAGTFLFDFLAGNLPSWFLILVLPVSFLLFLFALVRAYALAKKDSNSQSKSSPTGGANDSEDETDENLESLRRQLEEARVEQQFLQDLFRRSVTLMDELQMVATDLVPKAQRAHALLRLYETSQATDLEQFIQDQECRFGDMSFRVLVDSSVHEGR